MCRFMLVTAALGVAGLLMFVAGGCSDRGDALSSAGLALQSASKQNPDPGQDPDALPKNLSFPVIWAYPATDSFLYPYTTDTEERFIEIYENQTYPYADPAIVDYLQANGPWYPQPPDSDVNNWAADWAVSDETHAIHFIDWGNPMENITALVGQRFPVEVALFEKVGEGYYDEFGEVIITAGVTMNAYKMACLAYPASRDEIFGANAATYASCFATVMTSEFTATARKLDGGMPERIKVTTNPADLGDCDVIVEAITEDADAKAALLSTLAQAAPGADLATTTSSLSVAELGERAGAGERFYGLHVFNPVTRMELIELCLPEGVAREVGDRARSWCIALGKTPVEVPDQTAFVVNRLLFPYLFEAVRLMETSGMAAADCGRGVVGGAVVDYGSSDIPAVTALAAAGFFILVIYLSVAFPPSGSLILLAIALAFSVMEL